MPETKKKGILKKALKDWLPALVTIGLSLLYIGQGLFTINVKDTTWVAILGSIAMSTFMGFAISQSMSAQGLRDGRNSDEFQDSCRAMGVAKTDATPYFDKLPAWCDYKNSIELDSARKDIIQGASLKWKHYKVGYYDKYPPSDPKQLQALNDAKNCKIEKLKQSELTSDLPTGKFRKHRFGRSEAEFAGSNAAKDIATRIIIGIVSGAFILSPLVTDDNKHVILAQMLWNTSQVMLWIMLSVIKYLKSKSFMIDEYRQTHIIQKTELLTEFVITMRNNPKVIDEYDEDEGIDEYLKELADERKKAKQDTGAV